MTARPSRRLRRRLAVSVTDARGRPLDAGGLARWLASGAPRAARGTLAVALVSDAAMRRLNRTYRGVDAATDVLAFAPGPAGPPRGPARPAPHAGGPARRPRGTGAPDGVARGSHLGDLAIATGVARRQARAFGHAEAVEWRLLALHGLLHLLGYDHDRDDGAMRRLEERLRRQYHLPAGLTARAGPGAPMR
jgi:probable rRNA maturation factor